MTRDERRALEKRIKWNVLGLLDRDDLVLERAMRQRQAENEVYRPQIIDCDYEVVEIKLIAGTTQAAILKPKS